MNFRIRICVCVPKFQKIYIDICKTNEKECKHAHSLNDGMLMAAF